MMVEITALYSPSPEEIDEDDPTGLTAETFERLHLALMGIGLDDIDLHAAVE